VVRTEHLDSDEIEFLRWRDERWMKLRHMPAAFAHSPWFVLRHAPAMMAHTFTGTSVRSLFGLESARRVFARYRERRRGERLADLRALGEPTASAARLGTGPGTPSVAQPFRAAGR